jgi:hypothetical protein
MWIIFQFKSDKMIKNVTSAQDTVNGALVANCSADTELMSPSFVYKISCIGKDGVEKWAEEFKNLVTTVGKTDIIDKYFKGSAYTAGFFCGLKGTGTAVVGDTLASHAGWAEVNPYTGNRLAITFGTTTAGSNTATAVSFSITGSATVAGAFIATVNTGTSGTLYSAGDFAASRPVISGDTLNVTLTVSAS